MFEANYGAETFINLSRPFLGTMLEKYEIFGTRPQKWQHILLKSIAADQLPPAYSGRETGWKPLPIRVTKG